MAAVSVVCAQDDSIATLHVYTNLLQIPVLVVDGNHQSVPPVPASKFMVSLDSGAAFLPKHVRREGDDPITLAIVIDNTEDPSWLKPVAAKAIADAIPRSLQPRDHVTVYTLNCRFYREVDDVSAADLTDLPHAVEMSLRSHAPTGSEHHGCERHVHLWDALAYVTRRLGDLPGRRAVLVISDGSDRGSRQTWNEVRHFAVERSVALFGLNSDAPSLTAKSPLLRQETGTRYEDPFRSLCELSGGLVLHAGRNEKEVSHEFTRFIQLLRERYILEFPRLDSMAAGSHEIFVTLPDSALVIRPAGIAVPTADPALLADPMTIPPEPDDRETGTRRVLAPDK